MTRCPLSPLPLACFTAKTANSSQKFTPKMKTEHLKLKLKRY